jgi:hypothetical protein
MHGESFYSIDSPQFFAHLDGLIKTQRLAEIINVQNTVFGERSRGTVACILKQNFAAPSRTRCVRTWCGNQDDRGANSHWQCTGIYKREHHEHSIEQRAY